MQELMERITRFLDEKKKSVGGHYAPVTEEEIDEVYEIIHQLLALKYEEDPDGDLPVTIRLTDRTKYRLNHFFDVPHFFDRGPKVVKLALDHAVFNMSICMDTLSVIHRSLKLQEEK